MKHYIFLGVFSLLAMGLSKTVLSASADGNASAVIVEQGGIESEVDMDFGVIVKPSGQAAKVKVSTSGLITCGDANSGWVCTGSPSAGKFKVYGSNGTYSVSYADGILSDGKGNTMSLRVEGVSSITLANGEASLLVGGELDVGNDNGNTQASGTYSTSNAGGTPYTVTVNF